MELAAEFAACTCSSIPTGAQPYQRAADDLGAPCLPGPCNVRQHGGAMPLQFPFAPSAPST